MSSSAKKPRNQPMLDFEQKKEDLFPDPLLSFDTNKTISVLSIGSDDERPLYRTSYAQPYEGRELRSRLFSTQF
jgi:hypothetical protein